MAADEAPDLSFDFLWRWFEPRLGQEVLETELLRTWFPSPSGSGLAVDLELFQKHFLLYRRLWMFDDELRLSNGYRLWIRSIRITLVAPGPAYNCQWFDEQTGNWCSIRADESGYCARHQGPLAADSGLRAYYYDQRNLTSMTPENLETIMNRFYGWLDGQELARKALEALHLQGDETPEQMRGAWRLLSLRHHPDRGGDATEFRRINEAWNVLKNLTYF